MERYLPIKADGNPLRINPGKSITLTFEGRDFPEASRLHFTGETALFYQWKNEPDHPMLYRRIDDSLNTEQANRNQYCLDLSAEGFDYPLLAYYKVMFPPKLSYLKLNSYTDLWTFSLSVKTENLTLLEGGYLRFRAEIRYIKEGTAPRSTKGEPDVIYDLPIPEGTRDWTDLTEEIRFDAKNTASVSLFLEGERYCGKIYAESPQLTSETGWNLVPEFAPNSAERPQFTWMGINLSKKEWPKFEITLNGDTVYRGELFERCHRRAEAELPLKDIALKDGTNELTLKLISDYRDPLAYFLYDLGLICQRKTFLAACPRIVTAGVPFAVLVEGTAGTALKLNSEKVKALDLSLSENGLNAITLCCEECGNDIEFSLEYEGKTEVCHIDRCVLRGEDKVLTGTGDLVYIANEDDDVENYLKWYFDNQVGNLITIRPTYRWCGTRALNENRWRKTATLLNKAGMKYAHMLDGRELPGGDTNPSADTLKGNGFLGRQNHEMDGAFSYWGVWSHTNDASQEGFLDLFARIARKRRDHVSPLRTAPTNLIEKKGQRTLFRDLTLPDDMEIAARYTVEKLAQCRYDATRHTGPSTLFKYFYQAGYEWTGAELMYGPQETVCSALRGASRAYKKPIIGAHHAVQWSTSPHDTEEKNLRYRLALFGTYLQGVHDINTEEGLWHIEEFYSGFNRFSEACKKHTKQQTDFYRYVQTHTRAGDFYAPVAFLHGRYDGWDVFTRRKVWGKDSMPFAEPEKAWDLLTYFYPRNRFGSLYRHPCPKESVGYYSGTPYGNVDVLPAEAETYEGYGLLIAVGYNKAFPEDFDKMEAFVRNGGTLILGHPQCAVTTLRKDVVGLNHTYLDHPFRCRIACNGPFTEDTYRGNKVTVASIPADATVLLKTDSGRGLVYEVTVGKGRAIFLNAKEYAGAEGISAALREILDKEIPSLIRKERVYAEGNGDVQFALYNQPDGGKHVYFMATDWYNDPRNLRTGVLTVDEYRYTVPAPLGSPIKAVVKNGVAVWCNDWENDVTEVSETTFTAQGKGSAVFTVAKDGKIKDITLCFDGKAVQTVNFDF